MPDQHDPYGALRYRDYCCLLGSGVLATIGGEVQAVAVSWELYERTNSAAMLGLSGLALFLPVLLLAIPAGGAADRYSRKLLYQLAQCVMVVASLGLAALSFTRGPIPLVFGCLVLAGCARAFTMPSRAALLSQVVPPEQIANAVTWNSSGWQIANVAGPALGGFVVAGGGGAVPAYLVAACCALACIALLIPIRPRSGPTMVRLPTSLESLLAGVRFVWRTKLLLAAITLDLFAVLLGGATALLPIFARDVLHVGPTGLGWLRAAPAMGAFVMALLLAHRPPLRRAGRALLISVAGFGAATVAFGLSRDPVLSFSMLVIAGALDNVSVVVRGSLMQLLTPDEMRGRVAAVNAVFVSSSNELGMFESGVVAHWIGAVGSVVSGGIGTIVVVLSAMILWPELLRLGTLHSLRPKTEGEESVDSPPPPG